MDRELLIAAGAGEWRAALLEDDDPVELYVERGDRSELGSIHLGRVIRLVSGLGALLVDIGDARAAFLPQREIMPRRRSLHEGERVLVQIRREAQAAKAAQVTMWVRLRGRLLELTAGRPGLNGGEELLPEERGRILAAIETQEGRAGAGLRLLQPAALESLAAEADGLARRWKEIESRAASLDPPARLYPAASLAAALANAVPGAPTRIGVDDPGAILDLRAGFPEAAVAHRQEADWPVDLDAIFEQALSETVALPGRASVHFEAMRAAVLIDVDTGTPEAGSPERTGLAANLAAAAAIARQIRLRNLGGGIVVDFVGLDSRVSRERLRSAFAEALAADPAAPQILGWTRLGHLELVRARRGPPLAEMLLEPGRAPLKTAVTVAHEVLRSMRRAARAQPGRRWRARVSPDVAAVLTGTAAGAVLISEQRFAGRITIDAIPGCDRERFQISAL